MRHTAKVLLLITMMIAMSTGALLLSGCSNEEPSFVDKTKASTDISKDEIDTSNASDGIVRAHYSSDRRMKLIVEKDDQQYRYEMTSGEQIIVPLNMGSGSYTISIMINEPQVSDVSYSEACHKSVNVELSDENAPYLASSSMCEFTDGDAITQMAEYLTDGLDDDKDKVDAICSWVSKSIVYDDAKAEELSYSHDYLPSSSDTYSSRSGICIDYSSLTAAMLRSQGIPTKIMVGTYKVNGEYHSWNEALINGEWMTIDTTIKTSNPSGIYAPSSNYDAQKVY